MKGQGYLRNLETLLVCTAIVLGISPLATFAQPIPVIAPTISDTELDEGLEKGPTVEDLDTGDLQTDDLNLNIELDSNTDITNITDIEGPSVDDLGVGELETDGIDANIELDDPLDTDVDIDQPSVDALDTGNIDIENIERESTGLENIELENVDLGNLENIDIEVEDIDPENVEIDLENVEIEELEIDPSTLEPSDIETPELETLENLDLDIELPSELPDLDRIEININQPEESDLEPPSIDVAVPGKRSQLGGVTIFEDVTLTPSGLPIPITLRGISGGPLTASQVAGRAQTATGICAGFVDVEPDHRMELTDFFDYLSLQVESPADTVLVVRGPGGSWCNDDVIGTNPSIAGEWFSGTYDIWVGSYNADTYHPYVIRLAETE